MPVHLIADSTVCYDLGDGKIAVADFLQAGEILHFSPVTAIEIAAKVNQDTFAKCKSAAQAILDGGGKMLLDPQSHLTMLFGYSLKDEPFDWSHAVHAIAQAPDVQTLQTGVDDYAAHVRRRVVISEALHWRETTYDMWHQEMIDVMRDKIPKFQPWWDADPATRKEQVPKIKKKDQAAVLDDLNSPGLLTELILACQTRSFRGAVPPDVLNPPPELVESLAQAIDKVQCYCHAYIHYVIRLLTENMLPEHDDGGDLELFLYLTDDDHILVTSDKRWLRIAKRAGYERRIRKV